MLLPAETDLRDRGNTREIEPLAAEVIASSVGAARPDELGQRFGELPEPTQPLAANTVLNAQDGFEMEEADHAILASHATQLVGHFLVDANGKVGWVQIEAPDGPNGLSIFPTAEQLVAAAGNVAR